MKYVNRLNLDDKEREQLTNGDLLEKILSSYIGKKVLSLELQNQNVSISDKSLKDIITNDKAFYKDDKFSRTKYEEFLISNSLSAPLFEENIAEQEKKRQLLSFLSEGINIPNFMVQYEYNKENQTKEIKYIDLKKFYNKEISEEKLKKAYEKNKELFKEEYKKFNYLELKPELLIGENEYNENYFKVINEIENRILDGATLKNIKDDYKLSIKNTELINKEMKNVEGVKSLTLKRKIFDNFFNLKKLNSSEFLSINENFYLVELIKMKKILKKIDDQSVTKALSAQIKAERKIVGNTDIVKKINSKKFNENEMINFAKKNNLMVNSIKLNGINDNKIFKKGVIRRIFETRDNEINLITDGLLKDNYIVLTKKTVINKINQNHSEFQNYKYKARLNIANNIYNFYDLNLNNKYKVDVNLKTLDRIKNSF